MELIEADSCGWDITVSWSTLLTAVPQEHLTFWQHMVSRYMLGQGTDAWIPWGLTQGHGCSLSCAQPHLGYLHLLMTAPTSPSSAAPIHELAFSAGAFPVGRTLRDRACGPGIASLLPALQAFLFPELTVGAVHRVPSPQCQEGQLSSHQPPATPSPSRHAPGPPTFPTHWPPFCPRVVHPRAQHNLTMAAFPTPWDFPVLRGSQEAVRLFGPVRVHWPEDTCFWFGAILTRLP